MRGLRRIDYPVTVTNYERQTVKVESQDQLLAHLLKTKKSIKTLTLVRSGRTPNGDQFHPEIFISALSDRLLSIYIRRQRYGFAVLYADHEIPYGVLICLDIIQSTLDKIDHDKLKTPRKGNADANRHRR